MKTLYKTISFVGLGLMLVAALLVFNGRADETTYHILALVGTALWFVSVPCWMKWRLHQSE